MKRFISAILGILIVAGILYAPTFPDAYKKVSRATGLAIYHIKGTDLLGRFYEKFSHASCVFFEQNRCFTNAHLFISKEIGAVVVTIQHEDKTLRYDAQIDYWDGETDLVILKIEGEIPFEPVSIAENCEIGEAVMFGGYAQFPFPKIRLGKLNFHPKNGFFVFPIFNGDSGSGIFNMKGELLAIIYVKYVLKEGREETFFGYAIPLKVIKEFLKK